MPRGPKGEKRKADVVGNAVLIGRIAQAKCLSLNFGHLDDRSPRPQLPWYAHRGGESGFLPSYG
jgi:hypothetical protein